MDLVAEKDDVGHPLHLSQDGYGFLGVCALVPFILYGGFPYWAYFSAGILSIVGYITMAHGNKTKRIIKKELYSISSITLH